MSDFELPNWNAPLDLEERLAAVPDDAQVKGLFFRSARRAAEAKSGRAPGRSSYSALANYPTRELVEVLAGCGELAHPDVSKREALRRLGHLVFPAVRENPAGTFLFSVAGSSLASAVRLLGRAYSLFSTSSANLAEIEEGRAVVEIRNAWTFPDCYHLGVIEGSLSSFHTEGEIRIRRLGLSDVDLELTWR
jgi:uncharacterized protein (TIGR02265 family)